MPKKLRSSVILLIFTFLLHLAEAQGQSNGKESAGIDIEFFKGNRDKLRALMPERSISLIFSGSEKVRSNDVNYPFHQDPNFYYLTGFNEPDALLILFKEPYELGKDTINELIYVPGRSKEFERWNGSRLGTRGVMDNLGFKLAFQNTAFADMYIKFDYFDFIFYALSEGVISDDGSSRGDLASMLKHFKFKTDSLTYRINDSKLDDWIGSLREIKHDEEIALIQKAIDITCDAQKSLMAKIDVTYTEYKAEALIEYEFRSAGAESPGFPSIVGGGENSCVLHYVANNGQLKDGDLLVVDVGAEFRNYSADVTRTIPVNGKFSEEQKLIYNLVLEAQRAGIAKCRKGNKFWDPHEAVTEVIQQGLKKLGITSRIYDAKKYFMHGSSHYLGLDVHDAGTFQSLKVNNVITVEPGIYIPEGSDCDKKWWNIGIRIEDDVLITEGDPVVMSRCVPSVIEEIEALMKH